MLRRRVKNRKSAQVLMEYTLVIGAIILVIVAMSDMLKRGTQGMVKVVADQIGRQANAEQSFDNTGHLENSYSSSRSVADKTKAEFNSVVTYIFGDEVVTSSTAVINLGFTNRN